MKRFVAVIVLALAAALVYPSIAGEKGYTCSEDTQACLNHMVSKLKNRGWVGIEMDDSKGPGAMKVTRVIPGSPAEKAGFHAGDVLVSLNGAKLADEKSEQLEKAREKWTPGTRVVYTVDRGGKEVPITLTLDALPSDVMAQWIGMHMIEHAQVQAAEKK